MAQSDDTLVYKTDFTFFYVRKIRRLTLRVKELKNFLKHVFIIHEQNVTIN